MRSSLAKHTVQRLSSKRVRQIEIRDRDDPDRDDHRGRRMSRDYNYIRTGSVSVLEVLHVAIKWVGPQ